MSGHMGARNMHEGAISRDISLLMILALEGLWKGLLLSPCKRKGMEQALLFSPCWARRAGLVCPPMVGGTGWAGGRPRHGQVHRGSAPFPVLQLDFAACRTAAENSMFLLVSVGVESRASISDGACPLWSRGMRFGIFKPRDCLNCVK